MRFVFVVLVIANVALFVLRFDVTRDLVGPAAPPAAAEQLNAQRLRIVREAAGPAVTAPRTPPRAQPVVEPPA